MNIWSSGGTWNQWPLQQSVYRNVPHEEIDWAALAKQWIQLQQVHQDGDTSHGIASPLPHPPPPVSSIENTSGLPVERGVVPLETPDIPRVHSEDSFTSGGLVDSSYWNSSGWDNWSSTSAPVSTHTTEKEIFEYSHVSGTSSDQSLATQSFDYNHGSDQYTYNQMYVPENQYDQYWSQVGAATSALPPFVKKNKVILETTTPSEEDTSHIDAAKRKQLPAWIREGLEKMERERLKKLEKERAVKLKQQERLVEDRAQKLLDEQRKKGGEFTNFSSPEMPQRSKFESDSEIDEGGDGEEELTDQKIVEKDEKPQPDRNLNTEILDTDKFSHDQESISEEERQFQLMMKVRRMLTEVLLEVTNEEIFLVAKEVYQRAVSKATVCQLAAPSALASVASGLGGLAGYGSESDATSDEENSDEELHQRIRERKRSFAEKEKKIIAAIEQEEAAERVRKGIHQKEQQIKDEPSSSCVKDLKPIFIMPKGELPDNHNEDKYKSLKYEVNAEDDKEENQRLKAERLEITNLTEECDINMPKKMEGENSSSELELATVSGESSDEKKKNENEEDILDGKDERGKNKDFKEKVKKERIGREKDKKRHKTGESKSLSGRHKQRHTSNTRHRHKSKKKSSSSRTSYSSRSSSSGSSSSESNRSSSHSSRSSVSKKNLSTTGSSKRSSSTTSDSSEDRYKSSHSKNKKSRKRKSRSRSSSRSKTNKSRSRDNINRSRDRSRSHSSSKDYIRYKYDRDRESSGRHISTSRKKMDKYEKLNSPSKSRYEKQKKEQKRRSRSRSRSRIPKKYRRSSRSVSSGSASSGKRSSVKYKNR